MRLSRSSLITFLMFANTEIWKDSKDSAVKTGLPDPRRNRGNVRRSIPLKQDLKDM